METKVCSRKDCPHGGAPQPLSNFYAAKGYRDGHRNQCKECHKAATIAWKRSHPEATRAIQRRYHATHRESANARSREIQKRRDTPDGVQRNSLYNRAWRAKNAEHFREYQREYRRRYRAKKRAEKEAHP